MPVVRDVAVEADPTNTSNPIHTLDDVAESAVLCAVYMLRKVNFPSQAIVKSQFRCDAPAIFPVVEHAGLPFRGVGAGADIPAHAPGVSQEKTSQSQAARTAVRSIAIGEVVHTC